MKKIVLLLLTIGLFTKPTLAQLPDFTQTDCNGVSHHLYDDLAAGNAAVLKFCAGWCGPCTLTNPMYQGAWEEFASTSCKIKMYSMLFETHTVGEPTNSSYGTTYATLFGLTMPVLTDIGTRYTGLTGQYTSTYGMEFIPTTFIIIPNQQDPANSIVKMIVGLPNGDLGQMIKDSLALGGFYSGFSVNGVCSNNNPHLATLTSFSPTGNTWSTGQTTQSITVSQNGVYSLSLSSNGCTTSRSHTIEFNPVPAAGTISSSSLTMCDQGYIYLSYTPAAGSPADLDLVWMKKSSSGSPNDFFEIGPVTSDPFEYQVFNNAGAELQFIVRARNANGSCPVFSNQVNVTITNSSPTVIPGTASASVNTICPGTAFALNYSGGISNSVWEIYNYINEVWIPFANADQPIDPNGFTQLNKDGNHDKFRVRSPGGECFIISNEVEVNYFEVAPWSAVITGPTFSCADQNLTMGLNGTHTNIVWSTGATTSSIIVTPSATTWYSVSAVDGNGCGVYGNHLVDVSEKLLPVIQKSTPGSICGGGAVTLSFAGTNSASSCTTAVHGQWPFDVVFTPSSCNGVTELITSDGYLSEYSLVNVEAGKYYKFTSSGYYQFYNTAVKHIINTIASSDGSQVFASGEFTAIWKASFSGQVRVYTHGVDCGENIHVFITLSVACYTDPSLLGSFLWMPGGQTTPSITVNPATTTNYTLTFTDANAQCSASTTQQVIVGIGGIEQSTTDITNNSARMNWISSTDPDQWQLRYKSIAPGTKWIEKTLPASQRSFLATGLQSNTGYNWQLRAKCGKAWTSYSDAVYFVTTGALVTSIDRTGIVERPDVFGIEAIAMPNPTHSDFRITIKSANASPIKLFVIDVYGRIIETQMVSNGQTIRLGGNYKSGAYVVKVIQGEQSKQLKLIKIAE